MNQKQIIQTNQGDIFVHFCEKPGLQTKREFEKEQVSLVLAAMNLLPEQLSHEPSGRPVLLNSDNYRHISISHSGGWFAIYLAHSPVGIDVQTFQKRMEKGASHFVNANDVQCKNDLDLHLIWCAKEALYKIYSEEITNFVEEVTLSDIIPDKQELLAFYRNKPHRLKYKLLENAVLVFTIGQE